MLSLQIKPINNPAGTANYYLLKDNYYFTGELSALWQGEGATRLNLAEKITAQSLETLLNGHLPTGDIIGFKGARGEIKHRGGYDLTFSAPKSISYLALVGGHHDFIEAHQQAVTEVLRVIEQEAAQARKQSKEGMVFESTKNLCFAKILHDTSREQDPQLHTHALLMNFTQRTDGKWRALASDIHNHQGTMEWIMGHQIFLGLVYRSSLALSIKQLGLAIEPTGDAHGLFEIKHFDKTLLAHLSKRRQDIEQLVNDKAFSSLQAYDKATLATRKAKEAVTPETLRVRWQQESEQLGITAHDYWQKLRQLSLEEKHSSAVKETEAVKEAIAHLEDKKITFSYHELLQTSLYFALGQEGVDTLIQHINGAIADKRLVPLDNDEKRFTTQALIKQEKEIVTLLANFPAQTKAIPVKPMSLVNLTANSSIQQGVREALTSQDGIVRLVQSSATSKEVLFTLIELGKAHKTLRVLTPTRFSTSTINARFKHQPKSLWQWLNALGKAGLAETVAGFNHRLEHDKHLPFFKSRLERELLIVDDVQRLSPNELQDFLTIASARQAKVILLDKPNHLSGFKSDIPELLSQAQVKTIAIFNELKIEASVKVMEIKQKAARLQAVAEKYALMTTTERANTQVLTLTKAEASETNAFIRDALKKSGVLATPEKAIMTLVPIYLSDSERKVAKSYKTNWVLQCPSPLGVKRFKIIGLHEKTNYLTLEDKHGLKSHLLAKSLSVKTMLYEEVSLTVAQGEQLIATSALKNQGIKAGVALTVMALTESGLDLKQGKKITHVSTREPVPFNYRYARSLYTHDFKAVNHILLTLPAYALRKNIMTSVAETSKQSLTLFTDEADKASRLMHKASVNHSVLATVLHAAHKMLDNHSIPSLFKALEQAIITLTREKPIKSEAEKALQFAITHLSEREAVFSKAEVLACALQKTLGHVSLDDLQTTLNNLTDGEEIVALPHHQLTTQEAIDWEKAIVNTVKQGKNAVMPWLKPEAVWSQLAHSFLTKGQQAACLLITTTTDQFVMVQGYAGTGKTTMMRTVIDTLKPVKTVMPADIDIIAVAPTHQAVKEMRALGIKAQTLKSFLIDEVQTPTLNAYSLVLLDEASMVSNRDTASLIHLIKEAKAKGVLLGDISQHQSIESGKPHALLLQEGAIKVAWMNDIVRQTVSTYKQAVETLVKGDSASALAQLNALPLTAIARQNDEARFKAIKTSVVEVIAGNNPGHRHEEPMIDNSSDEMTTVKSSTPLKMAVKDYLSRTPACRENTLVVIHENKKREIANQAIRAGLIAQGELGGENKPFNRLLSTNFTTAELYHSQTYVTILNQPESHYLKKSNDYFKVMGVDKTEQVVELQTIKGEKTYFLPEKEPQDWTLELFKLVPAKLSLGDKIHFKKSDKALGRYANERLVVTNLREKEFTVSDASGNQQTLSQEAMSDSHWDYSYTSTSYSIQGSSAPFVIGVAETGNQKVNHFRSFYIMVSRASVHAMIYTDNYQQLQRQISRMPDKTSALEVLNHRSPSKILVQENGDKHVSSNQNEKEDSVSYDATLITQNLSLKAERVIESLLGAPNTSLSSPSEYRYGTKGSLAFCLQGDKRGTWFNFETGEKGNLLHLIQQTLHLDFKAALKYAAGLTGDDLFLSLKPINLKNNSSVTFKKESTTFDYAKQLAHESVALSGTLAEKYLKETRKIYDTSGQDIRFHPKVWTHKNEAINYRPALISIARDKEKNMQAVEVVYLDTNTANKASMSMKAKKTFGSKQGAAVILNEGDGKNCTTYITEGIETGLSIRDAVKNERVIVTLGKNNFKTIAPELMTDKVVFCVDNDDKPIHQDLVVIQSISKLMRLSKEVKVAMPRFENDFNDVAKIGGIKNVINELKHVINLSKAIDLNACINIDSEQIIISLKALSQSLHLKSNEFLTDNTIKKSPQLKAIQKEIHK